MPLRSGEHQQQPPRDPGQLGEGGAGGAPERRRAGLRLPVVGLPGRGVQFAAGARRPRQRGAHGDHEKGMRRAALPLEGKKKETLDRLKNLFNWNYSNYRTAPAS